VSTNTEASPLFRIGEVADRLGVTTRTIRYYEERGLLRHGNRRAKGTHRLYAQTDIIRLQELIRLRDLLGLSLEDLVEIAEAEEARACLRAHWDTTTDDEERMRILDEALPLVERQLELVTARQETLEAFAGELKEKLDQIKDVKSGLERGDASVVRPSSEC
jgi:MerR family transcriptional regulator, repressor of the yfmOP operon